MIKDRQTHVEMGKNKKERQSFDALSLGTPYATYIELFL